LPYFQRARAARGKNKNMIRPLARIFLRGLRFFYHIAARAARPAIKFVAPRPRTVSALHPCELAEMRLIAIGCEHSGVTTLLSGLTEWGAGCGITFHTDDHFTIPGGGPGAKLRTRS
jgi:hypothetical protein